MPDLPAAEKARAAFVCAATENRTFDSLLLNERLAREGVGRSATSRS